MTTLITGAAGFIGFHICKLMLSSEENIIGIDNLNNYYDLSLKKARLEILENFGGNFKFFNIDISHKKDMNDIFEKFNPRVVINLAAQAGVRYSIENPESYTQSNLVGFMNVIENCRNFDIEHFIYASSSSVYGGNTNLPFKEDENVDHPVSLYAATKKANELIAHSYSHLYDIPSTGLRFFTVYGPWGRPDMALFLFTKGILKGEPIKVFNNGEMIRDFTYIDDIVESIFRLIKKPPKRNNSLSSDLINPSNSWAPHKVFNIGNSNPVPLMTFINEIENNLEKKAKKIFLPMQPGDVKATSADTSLLEEWIEFKPRTTVKKGIFNFIKWYKEFYEIKSTV